MDKWIVLKLLSNYLFTKESKKNEMRIRINDIVVRDISLIFSLSSFVLLSLLYYRVLKVSTSRVSGAYLPSTPLIGVLVERIWEAGQ